ncbi:hypothetical protein RHMOL_Rhmol09G0160200 [Rhododendron molle]|uniref:Uncharacterized protein n=1 Tax=Rhododendron molle TaxID=49168 RepID=A0ACC0MDW8_RHOML|nr:hypothetical protein RHMOL_Rhmol09G0160200 [Rhododendron molle]
MSESPVEHSVNKNPVDGSGPSQPSGSPVRSSSPLDNHASDNPLDEVDVLSDKSDDDGGKRLRSPYWAHYNRVKIGGVYKAICKYCGTKMSGETRNGTSHLKEHYVRKHQKRDNMRQQVLTNNFMNKDRPSLLTSYSFGHETARKELANAMIMHEYPLSIMDHVGFRRYSNALQPLFKVPCRNTMKAEIFKIYEYQRGKTMSLVVSNASRLAITTDMWTSSNQKKGFMAVTAHFIDDSWSLQSRILRFIYVPCPHTKEVLCDQLLNCLMDWNIDRKISSITVDNCSTNDTMIDLLWDKLDSTSLMLGGDLFHMRCCAHILNLIVKDGLDVIKVIREMAKRMVENFDKYWSVVHGVVGVSAVLDPRYKINVLQFYFKLLFPTTYNEEAKKVCALCSKLLKEYQSPISMMEGIGDSSSQSSSIDEESLSKYNVYMLRESKRSRTIDIAKLESDHYLSEAVLPKPAGFDVLNWWKSHKPKYPILQAMARDLLAIPVSTVASESAFSTNGRLVSPHRSRLHPDTMEALMSAQSWLWVAEMKGESTSGYATISNDAETGDSCMTREILRILVAVLI